MGDMSFLSTMVSESSSLRSSAEYRLTGTLTSPKLTLPFQIACAIRPHCKADPRGQTKSLHAFYERGPEGGLIMPLRRRPMKIKEIMTPEVETVGPGASLQEAASKMRGCDCGSIPVVDG